MLKAVMFDMDGTIADTEPLCLAAFRAALEETGGPGVHRGGNKGHLRPLGVWLPKCPGRGPDGRGLAVIPGFL